MDSRLIQSLRKRKRLFGSKVNILSPAKINLYLNILGRYPGGYHELESIVEKVSLFDQIDITLTKEPQIIISSNNKQIQNNDNLCVKAISLMKKKYRIPYGFFIKLNKKIPIGSGLGGGSSNAASSIFGIDALLNLKLKKEELLDLGANLGSDVNFFLSESSFALLQGRGERIEPLPYKIKLKHFIIWPGINISTKEAYKKARVKLTKFFNNANIMQYALKNKDLFLVKKSLFNALEKSAFLVSSQLRGVQEYLSHKGIFTKVTGSGGALYTVDDISDKKIRETVPKKWQLFKVTTV